MANLWSKYAGGSEEPIGEFCVRGYHRPADLSALSNMNSRIQFPKDADDEIAEAAILLALNSFFTEFRDSHSTYFPTQIRSTVAPKCCKCFYQNQYPLNMEKNE